MRSARIAEWILSLVTAPERAASLAGDLAEEREARGALWFWLSLVMASASLAAGNFRNRIPQLFWRSAVGWIYQAAGLFIALVLCLVGSYLIRDHHILGQVATCLVFTATRFVAGRRLAYVSPRQEIAVWLTVVALCHTLGTGIEWIIDNNPNPNTAFMLSLDAALLAGAIYERRKRIRLGSA